MCVVYGCECFPVHVSVEAEAFAAHVPPYLLRQGVSLSLALTHQVAWLASGILLYMHHTYSSAVCFLGKCCWVLVGLAEALFLPDFFHLFAFDWGYSMWSLF